MNQDQQAQARKRLAAALRDNSASTMVKLALADYQRLLDGTATTATDDRLTRASHEIARLSGQVAELERRLRAAAVRETALHERNAATAPRVKHRVACPTCQEPMSPDSRARGSECMTCYKGSTKWGTKDLPGAVAKVNADPDRSFEKALCWVAVAEILGEPVRATQAAAKHRGLMVYPRPRRAVDCPGCGGQVIERYIRGGLLLCGPCQARQYRSSPLPLEVANV